MRDEQPPAGLLVGEPFRDQFGDATLGVGEAVPTLDRASLSPSVLTADADVAQAGTNTCRVTDGTRALVLLERPVQEGTAPRPARWSTRTVPASSAALARAHGCG